MLLSKQQTFSEGQVVTADAASTNVIDLGAPGTVLGAPAALVRDVGKGREVDIIVQLDSAPTGTSPTLDVDIEVDTVENFASPTIIASSQQKAGGAAGDRIQITGKLPEGANQRYIRLAYDVGGTSPSFVVTAAIVAADQTNKVPGA